MMQHVIVGGSGGIGAALIDALLRDNSSAVVHATWYRNQPNHTHPRLRWYQLDASEEASVIAFIRQLELALQESDAALGYVILANGLLHSAVLKPEKSISTFSAESWLQSINANTLPGLLLAKHFSPLLKGQGLVVYAVISAKVGSIADNRLGGWYSYRSSKAALNMAMKTLSIEWQRTHPQVCVAVLHPGTTATNLSAPFAKNVPPEQLFAAADTARYLLNVLSSLDSSKSGRFWAFDGEELPW